MARSTSTPEKYHPVRSRFHYRRTWRRTSWWGTWCCLSALAAMFWPSPFQTCSRRVAGKQTVSWPAGSIELTLTRPRHELQRPQGMMDLRTRKFVEEHVAGGGAVLMMWWDFELWALGGCGRRSHWSVERRRGARMRWLRVCGPYQIDGRYLRERLRNFVLYLVQVW